MSKKDRNGNEIKIRNSSEFIFGYDCTKSNPNGDILEGNKPRMDYETNKNIVSQVRMKRTARDYMRDNLGFNLLVDAQRDKEGFVQSGKQRAETFCDIDKPKNIQEKVGNIQKNVLRDCIDARLFGTTLPVTLDKKGGSVSLTGTVQMSMAESMHEVEISEIKGTGAFASTEGKEQQTFRTEYIVPYSMLLAHGVVSLGNAKHTEMTEKDLKVFEESLWLGTKHLITYSKFGQMPRIYMRVEYIGNFFIGELHSFINLKTNLSDDQIRKPEDYVIDVSMLTKKLKKHKAKIKDIHFIVSDRMSFEKDGENISLAKMIQESIGKQGIELVFE